MDPRDERSTQHGEGEEMISQLRFRTMFLVSCLLLASAALAVPVNPLNTRPVIVGATEEGAGTNLQTSLDTIFICTACVNPATDQSSFGVWSVSAFPYVNVPALAFEYSANATNNIFGIWGGTDSTSLTQLEIFLGSAVPGSIATLSWNSTGTTVTVTGGAGVNNGGSAAISAFYFGFFLDNAGSDTVYFTADNINPSGVAAALAYRKPGSDTFGIFFEDGTSTSGVRDYNDMVVKIESIQGVPEPSTLLLLGSGLAALGFAIRRKMVS
jgi:hypothetical protein